MKALARSPLFNCGNLRQVGKGLVNNLFQPSTILRTHLTSK
jgi:hypothetical protein